MTRFCPLLQGNKHNTKVLSTLATIAVFGDSRRFRRLSPFSATFAEFGDCNRQCGQGLNSKRTQKENQWKIYMWTYDSFCCFYSASA